MRAYSPVGDAVLAKQVLVDHAHARAACGEGGAASGDHAVGVRRDHRFEHDAAVGAAHPRLGRRARDAASGRRRCGRRCRSRRCCRPSRWGCRRRSPGPSLVDVAEDHLAIALRARPAGRARRSSCPRRGRSAAAAPGPRRTPGERRVGASTRTGTMRDTNLMPRLRTIAPGSRPGLEQHLEAVADPQHRPAPLGERRAPPA